jgi:hypothetical protein
METKMELTLEAAKQIFDLLDDDARITLTVSSMIYIVQKQKSFGPGFGTK